MKGIRRKFWALLIVPIACSLHARAYSQTTQQEKIRADIEQKTEKWTAHWAQELSLDPEQTAMLQEKLFNYSLRRNQLLHSKMRESVKTARLDSLLQEKFEAIQDILSPTQFESFREQWAEKRKHPERR